MGGSRRHLRAALRALGALGLAAGAGLGLPGCGVPAPEARLALRQVHGAPLEAPPRLALIYGADIELPFISQTCRGFNPLATGRRCGPTHEARAVEATRAPDGSWVFTFPEWVPGTVRHSVNRLDLALPGGSDVVPIREGAAGVSRAVLGEPVLNLPPSVGPGVVPTGRAWPGATRSVEYAHFRAGTLMDWSLDDQVWRAPGVGGAVAVNAFPPDAAWRARLDRCVEAIQAAVPLARPLGEVP